VKMSQERYAQLCDGLAKLAAKKPDARKNYALCGLSEMRFRWDALYSLKSTIPSDFCTFASDCYEEGLNDTHIDTALRRAVDAAWGQGAQS
jgi:hypothetical protein